MVGVTAPIPSDDELSAIYASGHYRAKEGGRFVGFVEDLIYLFRGARRRRIERFVKPGAVLDVGCGRGLFLDVMRRGGWSVRGVEFCKDSAICAAEAYGIEVVHGDSAGWGFLENSFDVITINHVLEHMKDPEETIRACRRLLRDAGLMVVAVPDISSLQGQIGRGRWFHLDIPYHLNHFTEAGLRTLIERHSLRVIAVRRFDLEHNPFGWLQTLLNLSGIRRNFLYTILKNPVLRKKEMAGASAADMLLTLILTILFFPLALALSLVESYILKRGGTTEIFALKENTALDKTVLKEMSAREEVNSREEINAREEVNPREEINPRKEMNL
jgi:SAM-dependent methyltransferase